MAHPYPRPSALILAVAAMVVSAPTLVAMQQKMPQTQPAAMSIDAAAPMLAAGAAASKPPASQPPELVPDVIRVEVGYTEPGEKKLATFELPNTSNKPFEVASAISECTCIRIVKQPSAIPPAGKASLQVEFIAPKESGNYTRRVVVLPKDQTMAPKPLWLSAEIGTDRKSVG